MAKYEVLLKPLNKSGESIGSLAGGLENVRGRLEGVLADLPLGFDSSKQQISTMVDSINSLKSRTVKMSDTLNTIAGIYKKAEQEAFTASDATDKTPIKTTKPQPLKLRTGKTQGVLFVGDLTLPDWLQMVVLKYEQSKK